MPNFSPSFFKAKYREDLKWRKLNYIEISTNLDTVLKLRVYPSNGVFQSGLQISYYSSRALIGGIT